MQTLSYLTRGVLPGLSLCFCSVSGFLPCALGLNLFCNLGLESSLYSLWFLIQRVRLHYLLTDLNWACPLGSQIWPAGRVFLPGPGIWQGPLVRSCCCLLFWHRIRHLWSSPQDGVRCWLNPNPLGTSAGPGLPLGQSYLQVSVALSLKLSLLHSFSTSPLLESPPHTPFPLWSYPAPFSFHSPSIPLPLSPPPSATLPALPSSSCPLSSFFSQLVSPSPFLICKTIC